MKKIIFFVFMAILFSFIACNKTGNQSLVAETGSVIPEEDDISVSVQKTLTAQEFFEQESANLSVDELSKKLLAEEKINESQASVMPASFLSGYFRDDVSLIKTKVKTPFTVAQFREVFVRMYSAQKEGNTGEMKITSGFANRFYVANSENQIFAMVVYRNFLERKWILISRLVSSEGGVQRGDKIFFL